MIWQYRGITILNKYNYCLLWRNIHGLCFSHELINIQENFFTGVYFYKRVTVFTFNLKTGQVLVIYRELGPVETVS